MSPRGSMHSRGTRLWKWLSYGPTNICSDAQTNGETNHSQTNGETNHSQPNFSANNDTTNIIGINFLLSNSAKMKSRLAICINHLFEPVWLDIR